MCGGKGNHFVFVSACRRNILKEGWLCSKKVLGAVWCFAVKAEISSFKQSGGLHKNAV